MLHQDQFFKVWKKIYLWMMITGQILFIHKAILKMKMKKINKFKWVIIIDINKYFIIKSFIKVIYYILLFKLF